MIALNNLKLNLENNLISDSEALEIAKIINE